MEVKMNMMSTGQASKLLSVTPDTILKWIKQGKIPAIRTPGGHYRISGDDIDDYITRATQSVDSLQSSAGAGLVYCWEYFAVGGQTKLECFDCLVYRAQAFKCYEMNHLSKETGYNGGSCSSDCDTCSYLRFQRKSPYNVLVICDNEETHERLISENSDKRLNLQFATCEYECSLLIDRFRPDFVVVDCAMQEDKCRELCHHLASDPRINGNAIILATPARRLSISFPGTARLRHPFSLDDLEKRLRNIRTCRSIKGGEGCGDTGVRH